ncbi:hypothetical protein SAMN02745165_03205 [Malonomonas rubra DSM 5091]|uniref:Uncharacterized protein n=1 Tax=Malonomonas rubra DSM 5091 TaxID=1122189 RepID=A0A1M6M8B0_MALRU|nr:hypothetical protein [Malonomonas rubra]SHJ79493.1 hypothetical protein SAMN02745165_03205 [Malonomonas rubra DSM 5091]
MANKAFYQNFIQAVTAIDWCIANRLQMPALMLIYSGIDSFSWAASMDKSNNGRTRFISWVEKYMLPEKKLPCTAEDIYSARCAILHTMTSESNLSKAGKAQRVAYCWGAATHEELHAALQKTGEKNIIALHIEDLHQAFRLGMAKFVEESETNEELKKALQESAEKHFYSMEDETVDNFLNRLGIRMGV